MALFVSLFQRQAVLMWRRHVTHGCGALVTWSRSAVQRAASAGRWPVLTASGTVTWMLCVKGYQESAFRGTSLTLSPPETRLSRFGNRFQSVSHLILILESVQRLTVFSEFQQIKFHSLSFVTVLDHWFLTGGSRGVGTKIWLWNVSVKQQHLAVQVDLIALSKRA